MQKPLPELSGEGLCLKKNFCVNLNNLRYD